MDLSQRSNVSAASGPVKNPPSSAGDAGLTPGQETKIPHTTGNLVQVLPEQKIPHGLNRCCSEGPVCCKATKIQCSQINRQIYIYIFFKMIPHLFVTSIHLCWDHYILHIYDPDMKKKSDKISPFVDLGIYWYGYDNNVFWNVITLMFSEIIWTYVNAKFNSLYFLCSYPNS